MLRGQYLLDAENDYLQVYMQMQDEVARKHHGKLVTVQKDMKNARRKTGWRDFFVKEFYTSEEQTSAIL
jgi:hypothetical protein